MTKLRQAEALASLAGHSMSTALFELNAHRPFHTIALHAGLPRVVFLSREQADTFKPAPGAWATCHVREEDGARHIVVTAAHEELMLEASVEVVTGQHHLELSEDIETSGSDALMPFEDDVAEALQTMVSNQLPPSLLVLRGHETLVAEAERASLHRLARMRGLWTNCDQRTGQAVLHDGTQEIARCEFETVGTWSKQSGSWRWGWANPSIEPRFLRRLAGVREFGEREKLSVLINERTPCHQHDAQRIAAIATHVMKAEACSVLQLSPTSLLFLALFGLDSRRN